MTRKAASRSTSVPSPYGAAARAARVTATGSPSRRYRSRSSDASVIERWPSTACTPSTPTAAAATSSRAAGCPPPRATPRRGRALAARGGITAAPHHRADRRVLHVRYVDRVGLQHGIGDAPRQRHRVAGPHDLLLRREHAAGVFEHVARAGHVGEDLR